MNRISRLQRAKQQYERYYRLTLEHNSFTPMSSFSWSLPFESATFVRNAWQTALETESLPEHMALYVHVPFCHKTRCWYCMYYSSILRTNNEVIAYLHYLRDKSTFFSPLFEGRALEALYIGGGTPSVLTHQQFEILFSEVLSHYNFLPNAERTCEQSFLTTSQEKISVLRSYGINRLSFGIQSIEPTVLKAVGRRAVPEKLIYRTLSYARKLGFSEINVDLMIGLPGETIAGIQEGLRTAVRAGAHCVTVYVFRHLKHHMEPSDRKKIILTNYHTIQVPEALAALRETATALGYVDTVADDNSEFHYFSTGEHLEGYSLIGYRTRPDSVFGNSVLGLGHSAFSFLGDFFRSECRDQSSCFDPKARTHVFQLLPIDHRQRLYVIESLYRDGAVNLNKFLRIFGLDFTKVFADELKALDILNAGLLKPESFSIRATNRLEFAALSKFFWDQEYLAGLSYGGSKA